MERAVLEFLVTIRSAINKLLQQLAPKTMDEVKSKIPEDLLNELTLEEKEEWFIIRPRQYLGAENFAMILDVVREMGGEYLSRGKDSHFRILKGA